MESVAIAKHLRQSPYKIRQILNFVRGKNINDAITVTHGQTIKYEDTFAVAFFLRAFTVSRKSIDELNIPNQISPIIE